MMQATNEAVEECLEKYDISNTDAEKMYTDPDFKYNPRFLSCFFTECGIVNTLTIIQGYGSSDVCLSTGGLGTNRTGGMAIVMLKFKASVKCVVSVHRQNE